MQKLEGQTLNVVQDNIEKLKELFPEVITENKIDLDKLRIALGDSVEKEKERYEFTWNGKTEAIHLAHNQTTGTLLPSKEESVNWNTTQNLYIEGDNLEVLRVLQSSYRNKVKMIYIDPPYNTGKDFVYKDDFHDNLNNYKEKNNESMKSNPETNGRYHTDWLNMMYPRLKIARNLLKENGVIFISIDDSEVSNLRKICDEIFGETNFVANLIWQKKFSRANDATYFSKMHDHILCYCKNSIQSNVNGWKVGLLPRGDEIPQGYSNPDNDPRGVWTSVVLSAKSGSSKLLYDIVTPSGRVCSPPSGRYWSVNKDRFDELVQDNRIWFGTKGDGTPRLKTFLSEVQNGLRPNTIIFHNEAGHNQEGKQETKSLFNNIGVFDGPKPVRLLKLLLTVANLEDEDIVLDFFSGSATMAHAVMELNEQVDAHYKFILVQLPEQCDEESEAYKAGYKTICDIGKERIRRAGKKILQDNGIGINQLDVGFKVFKLDKTNLKIWDEESLNLEKDLLDLVEPVKEGRTQDDVVYEILLKYGIDLTIQIEEKSIAGKTVFSVGLGYLLICLERDLTLLHIEEMAKQQPARIVFYDEGFKDDTVRTNAQQILKRYGVDDIRVI
ncbi:adenine-specific DNA-methyltransferase [Chryseomicrobium aureum]|uniref:site-specific DNA-methyltransferase n=1 Tax=Chryseomicrobium aureum TaxID=1441723 RepID=UPI001955FEA0|nr:site-specific DNA-methyltransferase [Chryseomicrobium aureum]MBM7707203.1 adenine-specific DNA-methyltransferase [Chryseomicrobium aureum]